MADQTPLALTFDALEHIMKFTDNQTISAMMKTNHDLHYVGAKYLLDTDCVLLEDDRAVISWMACMESKGQYRYVFLRGLEFGMETLPESVARTLEQHLVAHSALLRITHLILRCSEPFLESNPALVEALAWTSTLKQLEMTSAGPLSSDVIRSTQSKLSMANLSMVSRRFDNSYVLTFQKPDATGDRDPIRLLRNSASTLQALRIDTSSFCSRSRYFSGEYDDVYPHLYRLELPDSVNGVTYSALLARAYPNLRVLHLKTRRLRYWKCDDYRESNIREQRTYAKWTELEAFRGPVADLYALAPQCPVKSLILIHMQYHYEERQLSIVLQDAKPRFLSLCGMYDRHFTGGFMDTIRSPYAAQIECLEFMLHLTLRTDAWREENLVCVASTPSDFPY